MKVKPNVNSVAVDPQSSHNRLLMDGVIGTVSSLFVFVGYGQIEPAPMITKDGW
jgi:hypothetical protein